MAVTLYGSKQNIIQVIQTVKTDTFSTTSTSYVDVTGLSVSITPSSSSNKILVIANTTFATAFNSSNGGMIILRDSTSIYQGNAGSGQRQASVRWPEPPGGLGCAAPEPVRHRATTGRQQQCRGHRQH